MLIDAFEQCRDPLRPEAFRPVRCNQVRIVVVHDAIIGIRDPAGRGVVALGQFGKGYESVPIIRAGPARRRHPAVAALADRHACRGDKANVAIGEGIYEVLHR